jgi:ATP-dependent Clp endopeptidase proteolytic subunit ClpP
MKKFRLDGVVGFDFTAASVAAQLLGAGDVEVTLNSQGGDVLEGMAIYNAFNDHQGAVKFVIDQAMSMATIIMLAGDERVGRRESSMIMIHRPWGMGMGNADDMRESAEILDKMQGQMQQIYLSRMNCSEDELAKMLDDETYMDADEAMACGLITSVVSGSRNALHKMAFAALASDETKINKAKYAAKVKLMESRASELCAMLHKAVKLQEIEGALRTQGLSRADATAIVAAVKRVHCENAGVSASEEAQKALNLLNTFKL